VEIDALHKAAVEAMPVVHEETQAEKLEKARAGRRSKGTEPSKEQKEAMRKLEEEAAKEEARIEAVRCVHRFGNAMQYRPHPFFYLTIHLSISLPLLFHPHHISICASLN